MSGSLNRARLKTNHELLPAENVSQDIAVSAIDRVPSSKVAHQTHQEKSDKSHLHDDRYLKLTDKASTAESLSGTDDSHWIHSKGVLELFMSLLAKTQRVTGRWEFEDLIVRGKGGNTTAAANFIGSGSGPSDILAQLNATNAVTGEVHSLVITAGGGIQFNGRTIAMLDEVLLRGDTAVNSESLGGDISFKWQNVSKGMLPFPTGGRLEYQGVINSPICITLPDTVTTLYGMSVAIYQTGIENSASTILHLNGMFDEGSMEWSATDAYLSNRSDNITVEFGVVNNKAAIWISNPTLSWSNPMVTVMNLSVSRPDLRDIDWYANGINVSSDVAKEAVSASNTCVAPQRQYLDITGTSENSKKLLGKVFNLDAVADTLVIRDGSGRGRFTNVIISEPLTADNVGIVDDLLTHTSLALRDERDNTFKFITKTSLERWLTKASLTEYGLVKLSDNTEGDSSSLAATEKALGKVNSNTKRLVLHNPENGHTINRDAAVTTVIMDTDTPLSLTIGSNFLDGDEILFHRVHSPTATFTLSCNENMAVYFPEGKVDGTNHTVTGTCKLHLVFFADTDQWVLQVLTG